MCLVANNSLKTEKKTTVGTIRWSDRRLCVTRGQIFQNMCRTENSINPKNGGREYKCATRNTHKASRHHASRPTWAGSGRRLAMDCVRKEKPCLRRCHGITHKQHRTTHSVSIPCPLPSTDTKNTRKMVSRDQLCGKPHHPCRLPSPRASRALQGVGQRCTSAASRANPCKTAPASCRRPGTRTGRRRGRNPTPGSPALWTRAKQKRKFGQKGRLNVRSTAQKTKTKPHEQLWACCLLQWCCVNVREKSSSDTTGTVTVTASSPPRLKGCGASLPLPTTHAQYNGATGT